MSLSSTKAHFVQALERCGFQRSLIRSQYQYADFRSASMEVRTADLVAFSSRPFDFHTACVAAEFVPPRQTVKPEYVAGYWALGAPVVFLVSSSSAQWWILSAGAKATPKDTIPLRRLSNFFDTHADEFAPARIIEAKNRVRQLDFVDAGLLPALNHEVGEKLHSLVEDFILKATYLYKKSHGRPPSFPQLFRLVIRLLTGKIMKDKGTLRGVDFSDPDRVLSKVADYYGKPELSAPILENREVRELVSQGIGRTIRFHNLTSESLAHIYENTLVTEETREKYGTHSTPRYIADYITSRLPINEIPVAERHVFDPGVGCASFLVSAMRRLRLDLDPSWSKDERHTYFVDRLYGFDIDDFALETAKLSLTLADFPNHDGWSVDKADLWTTNALENGAHNATIFVANPPFENFTQKERTHLREQGKEPGLANKASELLRRVLPHLPTGALVGVVLPRETLEGTKSCSVRHRILNDFNIIEICLLPQGIFTHSAVESGILLAKKGDRKKQVLFRHVRPHDRAGFEKTYETTSQENVPQEYFHSRPDAVLRIPMIRRVWEHLSKTSSKLEAIADVGQGLTYKSQDLPPGTHTVSPDYFPGAVRGYGQASHSLGPFQLHSPVWMNIDDEVMSRRRKGADTGIPQVLFNYGRSSTGPWRAHAAVDHNGFAVTGNFYVARPLATAGDVSLELLAALITGPVTNAYLYAIRDEQHNSYPLIRRIPIPDLDPTVVEEIEASVVAFQAAIEPGVPMQDQKGIDVARLLLAKIDALLLELYHLPRAYRKQLVQLFAGYKRPRLPFDYELSEDLLKAGLKLKVPHRERENPWLKFAGMWENDPTWDDFVAKVAAIRESQSD